MSVELGLAIVATVDLCFKHGQALYEACGRYRRADDELRERMVRVQNIWLRTESQLKFVHRVAPVLSDEQWNIQEETLKILANKLDVASTKVCSFLRKNESGPSGDEWTVRNSKYAVFGKSLDATIDELEVWQKIFDPSWFLIMQAAKPGIDIELQNLRPQSKEKDMPITKAQTLRAARDDGAQQTQSIFLRVEGLDALRITAIPYCSSEVGVRVEANRTTNVVLDHVICPPESNPKELKKNLRNLARKLLGADPFTFGLLNCKGVVEHEKLPNKPVMYTMVFRVPQEYSQPHCLRAWLLDQSVTHSLSDRFQVASQLAKSVGYVHTFGFVHKNILPETILLFPVRGSGIGAPLLVGFGSFRDAEGGTRRTGDDSWEKNIYRHPRRQGRKPKDDYIMQHDIYSLGVCLLEIGLWESLVHYEPGTLDSSPSPILDASQDLLLGDANKTKEQLLHLTRNLLPTRMGTRYANVVETCLTCLDEDNVDFGNEDEFTDDDGIQIGTRYIEKVLVRLHSICV